MPQDVSRASAAPSEGVRAVSRALQILDAFGSHEYGLTLADLARRLGMEKSTVLRTARTLELAGYLVQREDARWRLGPASGWLGVRYQTAFDLGDSVDTVLRWLADTTGETTALFVHEGRLRTCVARVEKASLVRQHIRVGEYLPLDRGASGHVLRAFSGEPGPFYDTIRRRGFYVSVGERDRVRSSISTPVFGAGRHLYGALCISGMADELGRTALLGHRDVLLAAAGKLSRALVNTPPAAALARSA